MSESTQAIHRQSGGAQVPRTSAIPVGVGSARDLLIRRTTEGSRAEPAPTVTRRHPAASRRWLMSVLLAVLAGCSSPLVKPGPQTVDGLPLNTPLAWSDLGHRGQRMWTRDGAILNALRIYTDIEPGEHVFRTRLRGERDEGARFRAGLTGIEISELIVEALRGSGLVNVVARDLRPASVNGRSGFRAELSFDSAAGLHYRGLLAGEGEDGSLSFLMYTAPAEFYFERDRAAVEAIFDSLAR